MKLFQILPAEVPVELIHCSVMVSLETVFLYLFSSQISMSAVHLRATSMADVSMDWVPLTVIANLAFMVMVSCALSWQVSNTTTRVIVAAAEQQDDLAVC